MFAMSEVVVCIAASGRTHSPKWRCSSGCTHRHRASLPPPPCRIALYVIHCCISHVCRESYASRRVILGNSGCARYKETTRKRNVRETRESRRCSCMHLLYITVHSFLLYILLVLESQSGALRFSIPIISSLSNSNLREEFLYYWILKIILCNILHILTLDSRKIYKEHF